MSRCNKAKNPCKICLGPVSLRNGIQCQGACQTWVHFSCLNYTPGKIKDIKAGIIRVTCPCPDCKTSLPKEYRTDVPFSCNNQQCPANRPPKCENKTCPLNDCTKKPYCPPTACPLTRCGTDCKEFSTPLLPHVKAPRIAKPCAPPPCPPPDSCPPSGCGPPSCGPKPASCQPPPCPPPSCPPPPCNPPPPPCNPPPFPPPPCQQPPPCPPEPCPPPPPCPPRPAPSDPCFIPYKCYSGCSSVSTAEIRTDYNMQHHRSHGANEAPSYHVMEQMCNTVGQLTNQINDLMYKMKQVVNDNKSSRGGSTGGSIGGGGGAGCVPCTEGPKTCRQPGPKHLCPKPCYCPGNPMRRK